MAKQGKIYIMGHKNPIRIPSAQLLPMRILKTAPVTVEGIWRKGQDRSIVRRSMC